MQAWRKSVIGPSLLTLRPLRRRDNGLAVRRARRINNAILPALHLCNYHGMSILAVSVELDRPKRSHAEVQILDRVANPGAVHGLGINDRMGRNIKGCVSKHPMMRGMGVVPLEVFRVEFFGAGPRHC